jgi:carbon monoxide dehydrogenase subunit G
MKFSHEIRYDATPEQVYAMLVDPDFREAVCEAATATVRYDVDVDVDASGDEAVVRVEQFQPSTHIPSFARKFVGDEIEVRQTEKWSDPSRASLLVEIPGKPGRLTGTVSLAAEDDGTVETVSGDLKVGIPMVGGKLESMISDLLKVALRSEEKVGRSWLARDRA